MWGMGLGIGLGVPLLAALGALVVWPRWRRRKAKAKAEAAVGGGSETGEPLVDWKGRQEQQQDSQWAGAEGGKVQSLSQEADASVAKSEVHGQHVVEMPGRMDPVEVEGKQARDGERFELEGDVGR